MTTIKLKFTKTTNEQGRNKEDEDEVKIHEAHKRTKTQGEAHDTRRKGRLNTKRKYTRRGT